MNEFLFRSEDITNEELLKLYVDSAYDRSVVDKLKGRNPIVLVGSRGVGKSFLMRVAHAELAKDFDENRVLPVYLSFSKSALVAIGAPQRFLQWMMAKVCAAVLRELGNRGLLVETPSVRNLLGGASVASVLQGKTRLESLAERLEESWAPAVNEPSSIVIPQIDEFQDAVREVSTKLEINRIAIFIDEAAHVLLPEQQRAFFTLFRDLRSPYVTCNAAVYPGTTFYGDVFEPSHDATFLFLSRDVLARDYLETMRDIALKQADSGTILAIEKNGKNFSVLAYAATGNPRALLKTLARAPKMNARDVNEVFRTFYKTEIWGEHSGLGGRYPGVQNLVDWGRSFLEQHVLPALKARNDEVQAGERSSSAFLWVHRDAPTGAFEALRILCYGGLLYEHSLGIKATRSEVGTRYLVNLGCLFALESSPVSSALEIARGLDPRRMLEFGSSHGLFAETAGFLLALDPAAVSTALARRLDESVDVLDLTDWQRETLNGLGLTTIGRVLAATESDLQRAHYVGEVRSRRMRNAAVAAVMEYLSG